MTENLTPELHDPIGELRKQIEQLVPRVQCNQAIESDFIPLEKVRFDCDPRWIQGILANKRIHDEDYRIFKHFDETMGTILDVGANYGYSVTSMRSAGCNSPVISFEVSPAFAECLTALKSLDAGRYDFIISGVGSEQGYLNFLIPTVNGMTFSALTTASDNFGQSMIENIVANVTKKLPNATVYEAKFLRMSCKIDTIDHLLDSVSLDVPKKPIAAIKIDVEGLEFDAMKGATQTILEHKPLLLLEGGNRPVAIRGLLDESGYIVAERAESNIELSSGLSQRINGIFVHRDKVEQYRRTGLLQPTRE